MKLLLTFEKGEPVRWLGHLDVMRAFERAIRRSGLPIAFTSGYNPRVRLSFASALGVGVTGDAERAVIELAADLHPNDAVAALNAALPAGIRVTAAEPIADAGSRERLNAFRRCELQLACTMPGAIDPADLQAALDRAMARAEWLIERKTDKMTQTRDIRPYIRLIRIDRCAPPEIALRVEMDVGQNGTARPGEIVSVLQSDVPGLALRRAHRVRLMRPGDGDAAEPERSSAPREGGENPS